MPKLPEEHPKPLAENGGVLARLRRLPVIKSIIALALALAPLWQPFYNAVEAIHNADFLLGIRENPRMTWLWQFVTSQMGTFLVMVIGLAWLAYLILRKPRNQGGSQKQALPPSTETPAESNDAAIQVEILTPLNLWKVGWRQMVRGKVYPPENSVQVLVRPPDGAWRVQAAEVNGGLWTARCQFGDKDKRGMSYKIMAVYGNSLKKEEYDDFDLPSNLTRTEIITVNRGSNEDVVDCIDKQLHQTKIDDRSMIGYWVKVCRVGCDLHIDATEGDLRQYIDFDFWFLNLSLVPVSIESINGSINFRNETSAVEIKLDGQPKLEKNIAALNRPFRSDGRFYVRHFLAPHDVTTVKSGSERSEFKFRDLNIMITGGAVDVRLAIPDFVYKGKPSIASGECDFVFASIAKAEAKIRELETADASPKFHKQRLINGLPVRLIHAKPEVSSDPKLTFPSKVRCEFENIAGVSIKVRNSEWIPGAGGVTAEMPAATLQLRVGGKWCPTDGTEEIHVPPGERFRSWIAPGKQFTADELQRRCVAKELGTIVLLVNGQELKLSL